jgi:hypothetical protein
MLRSGDARSAKEMHDDGDDGENNEQVDQTARDVKRQKPKGPKDEENDSNRQQHLNLLLLEFVSGVIPAVTNNFTPVSPLKAHARPPLGEVVLDLVEVLVSESALARALPSISIGRLIVEVETSSAVIGTASVVFTPIRVFGGRVDRFELAGLRGGLFASTAVSIAASPPVRAGSFSSGKG